LARPSATGCGAGRPKVRANCRRRFSCASPWTNKLYPDFVTHSRTVAGLRRPSAIVKGPKPRWVSSGSCSDFRLPALAAFSRSDFALSGDEIEKGTLLSSNWDFVAEDCRPNSLVSPLHESSRVRLAVPGASEVEVHS